jgi:hypothetical protein
MVTATHRPDSVDYHIEIAGNFQKASEALVEWIRK